MKKLDDLKKLHESTTQGEWQLQVASTNTSMIWLESLEDSLYLKCSKNMDIIHDTKFIAESHKYFPRLIKALEKCMEQRRAYVSEVSGGWPDLIISRMRKMDQELEQILEGKNE